MPRVLAAYTGFWPTVPGASSRHLAPARRGAVRDLCALCGRKAQALSAAFGRSRPVDASPARNTYQCADVLAESNLAFITESITTKVPAWSIRPPGRTVGQKPVKAAKTLGMFRPPESLNSARIERMTP